MSATIGAGRMTGFGAATPRAWRRPLAGAGIVAPLLYVLAVVVGGAVTPGYSHIGQAISELTATGVPHRNLIDPMFVIYDLLLIGFALGLAATLPTPRRRLRTLGAVALALTGLAGLGMSTFFQMDQVGAAMTGPGRVHIVLAAVAALMSMAAVAAVATAAAANPAWRRYAGWSFVALGVIAATGAWAGVAVIDASPLLGLAERLTIGTFIAWVFGTAILVFREARRSA